MMFSAEAYEKCGKCRHEKGCSGISRVHCLDNEHCFFHSLTNADRIRSLSDEELAVWHEQYCPNWEDIDMECQKESCELCWLDWLKEEWMND